MPGIVSERIERNRALDRLGIDAISSPTGEVVGTAFDDALTRNPFPSLMREIGRTRENVAGIIGEMTDDPEAPRLMEPDEANERFGIEGKLKFDGATTENVAREMNQLKREELQREDVFRRAKGGVGEWSARLGAGLAASALDPLNIASAFIPVVGPARHALWLERAGSGLARAAVRARVGAVEGAVGAAVVEPLVYGVAKSEQADYGAMDSLLNLAFGTALGGGLHAGAGAVADRVSGRFAREIEAMPLAEREGALRSAIAQVAEGRPVDVEAFMLRQEMLSSTTLARQASPFEPRVGGVEVLEPAPTARVLLPMAERDAGYTRYATEDEAAKVAARLERRTGETVEVRPTDDGKFILARESQAEPVRTPEGTARTFPTERQATRFVEQQLRGEKVDIVQVGPAGKKEFAILRGASEQDLRAIKANPESVDLGRAEDRSAAASLRAQEAKSAERQVLARADMDKAVSRIVRQDVAGYIDPVDIKTAQSIPPAPKSVSPEIARQESVKDVETALQSVSEAIAEAKTAGRLTAGDLKALEQADELVKKADTVAKIAKAGAACMAGS